MPVCRGRLRASEFCLRCAQAQRPVVPSGWGTAHGTRLTARQPRRLAGQRQQRLLSRHLHSVQIQVRSLQVELDRLKGSSAFSDDRLDNLESISKSLCGSVEALSARAASIERVQALQAAGLQAQAASLSRLARRLASLEQATF